MYSQSIALFEKSQVYIPGGVNSPVRAFRSVGGTPIFIHKAKGAHLWDVDGRQYLDYVGSWGPMILGHAHPEVIKRVQTVAQDGLSFGAPTQLEFEMAQWLCTHLPSIEQVRLVSSGTEATMSAIRLARGYTQRSLIVKFEGCYHGHGDALLVKAGSGALTFGQPSSAGVPAEVTAHTLVLEYNNTAQIEQLFQEKGQEIAAVIIEPVAGNMNLIRPKKGYLERIRELCTHYGTVLIFDEVMTGFRVHPQGAQGLYHITPDLTTLGKIIGGGMPVGAFGGKREIMQAIAPLGGVYQAGTLSGNPVAVAAGLTTLELTRAPGFYEHVSHLTRLLVEGLTRVAAEAGIAFCADSVGGMFGLYFAKNIPTSYAEVTQSHIERFKRFFHQMLERGIYLAPSAYEAGFVSAVHTEAEILNTIAIAHEVFKSLK